MDYGSVVDLGKFIRKCNGVSLRRGVDQLRPVEDHLRANPGICSAEGASTIISMAVKTFFDRNYDQSSELQLRAMIIKGCTEHGVPKFFDTLRGNESSSRTKVCGEFLNALEKGCKTQGGIDLDGLKEWLRENSDDKRFTEGKKGEDVSVEDTEGSEQELELGIVDVTEEEDSKERIKRGETKGNKTKIKSGFLNSRMAEERIESLLKGEKDEKEDPTKECDFFEMEEEMQGKSYPVQKKLAEEAKAIGTNLFSAKDFKGCILQWKKALTITKIMAQMFDKNEERKGWAKRKTDQEKLQLGMELNVALCCLKLQRYDESVAHSCAALMMDRGNAKGWYRKAMVHVEQKEWKTAEEDLLEAQKAAPDDLAICKKLREVQKHTMKTSAKEEAKEKEFKQGVEILTELQPEQVEIGARFGAHRRSIWCCYHETLGYRRLVS
jgi:tetratricopeptide (TPR) repeat protein